MVYCRRRALVSPIIPSSFLLSYRQRTKFKWCILEGGLWPPRLSYLPFKNKQINYMRSILSTFLLLGVFYSYGQRPISCVINNTVLFENLEPDQDKFEYVIVDRNTDLIDGINHMLMFVVPQRNNLIMSFRGEEREVIYNPKKRRYIFDGGTYKTYPDLLSAVKFFLLTN